MKKVLLGEYDDNYSLKISIKHLFKLYERMIAAEERGNE
jgi:hypothetical protein